MFWFQTSWGGNVSRPFTISGNAYETFLPWSEVFIALNITDAFPHRDFYVNLYDLQTPEKFLNFIPGVSDPGEPIDKFELELVSFEITSWRSIHYLFLGRTLPEGYYLATIRSPHDREGFVLHKFIQVSAISVYSLAIEGETVFWIHDATTHEPARGAEITIGDTTVVTDSQGVAIAPTHTPSYRTAIVISYGNYLPFAFTTRTFAPPNLRPRERFLTFIYTDRSVYRTNDTIDVFGVILPRPGQEFLPNDTFVLRFADMIEIPIDLDEHGSFNKRIPVTNMFGQWSVEVDANGEWLMAAHIEFLDYTNFSFVGEGSLDRFAYFDGENAQFEVSVTNFAEIPLQGVDLRHYWGSGEVIATTDEYGIAISTLPVRGWSRWQPSVQSFWLSITGDAQASQIVYVPHIVASKDIMMEVEMPNNRTAILTTSRISLDRLNAASNFDAATELLSNFDNFRAEHVNVDFTLEITRHTTTRTVDKQWYDHINRRTITRYSFTTTSENVSITEGRTINGVATLNDLPLSNDPMIRYSIWVRYEDSQGRWTNISIGDERWWFWHQPQETSIRSFHLDFEGGGRQNTTSIWEWRRAWGSLKLGETGNIILFEGETGWNSQDEWVADIAPVTEGRMLVVMARDGLLSATVGSPQGTPITFPEEAISNAIIFGAYFDAGHIFPVNEPISVQYNFLERSITVDLTFDQESYSPGSDVMLNVRTTDISGNPVPARITISVVDESSILHRQYYIWDYWWDYQLGNNASILSRLYLSGVISPWSLRFEQFASFRQHEFGSTPLDGGGFGGGDGPTTLGSFRRQFIDNPIFEVIHTDQSGTGTLTFTLPDQLTSWRVTALALTTDGFAGDSRENIISTLPFNVNLLLTNEYIVGDDIAAAAIVTAPSDISNIELIFEVLQDGEVLHTYSTTTNRRAEFNAGKLPAGSYTMRVAAITDTHQDGVELPFTVANGSLIIQEWATFQLSSENPNIPELEMRNFPVQITFTNGSMRPLANILRSTIDRTSFRTDQIAAAAFSNVFFSGRSEEEVAETVRRQVHADAWRGIAELTYESANFYYTARFAASFPLFVNREGIIEYIRRELERQNYLRRHAAGLWALAAMGEPVLVEILELIADTNGLFDTSNEAVNYYMTQLYLVAALISIGNYNTAQQLFMTINSAPQMSAINLELANTLKLFINTAINPPAAWDYLRQNNINTYVSDTPERVNFVRRAVVLGQNISEVQYYLNGETYTLRLENFERKSLNITKEQFDNLNLVPIIGDTDFFVNFYSYSPNTWPENERRLTITRTISQENDLVRIDLHVELPPGTWGSFVIYDRLPSNLRFVPVQGHTNQPMSVRNTQQQLMEIRFWHHERNLRTRTLTYYAMQLFDGDMADGTTYIHGGSWNSRLWGATE